MTTALIPSAEIVLSYYLRNHAAVSALIDDHVYTTIPERPAEKMPLLRLTRIGGSPVATRPLWIDQAVIQIDCYGAEPSMKANSEILAHTARAAVCDDFPGYQAGSGTNAVITDVSAGGLFYQPDEAFTPPKPRYLFDVTITLHPAY